MSRISHIMAFLTIGLLLNPVNLLFASEARLSHPLLDQLEGTWVAEQQDGSRFIENWWHSRAGKWLGTGYSVNVAGDTTGFEHLELNYINHILTYIADVPHNTDAIHFSLREAVGDSIWVFANDEHDFPKRISYYFDSSGSNMRVVVDDGPESGKGFELLFKRTPNPSRRVY